MDRINQTDRMIGSYKWRRWASLLLCGNGSILVPDKSYSFIGFVAEEDKIMEAFYVAGRRWMAFNIVLLLLHHHILKNHDHDQVGLKLKRMKADEQPPRQRRRFGSKRKGFDGEKEANNERKRRGFHGKTKTMWQHSRWIQYGFSNIRGGFKRRPKHFQSVVATKTRTKASSPPKDHRILFRIL
eukprot:116480_1